MRIVLLVAAEIGKHQGFISPLEWVWDASYYQLSVYWLLKPFFAVFVSILEM